MKNPPRQLASLLLLYLVALPAFSGAAAAPEAQPALLPLPPLAARPDHVIGRAVFADGRPIPQFKVTALGWSGEIHLGPTGTAPNLGSLTAKDGRYAIRPTSEIDRTKPVRALVVSVYASALLSHQGRNFALDLHPLDGKKDGTGDARFRGESAKGVVRDFVLRLSGPRRGSEVNTPPRDTGTNNAGDPSYGAFYGGTLSVSLPRDASRMEGATATLTLTPVGALFDGSPAKTVTRRLLLRKPDIYTAYFRDIPLGDYTAAMTVNHPDGTVQPLRLRILGGEFQATAPVAFEPLGSWGVGTKTVLAEL